MTCRSAIDQASGCWYCAQGWPVVDGRHESAAGWEPCTAGDVKTPGCACRVAVRTSDGQTFSVRDGASVAAGPGIEILGVRIAYCALHESAAAPSVSAVRGASSEARSASPERLVERLAREAVERDCSASPPPPLEVVIATAIRAALDAAVRVAPEVCCGDCDTHDGPCVASRFAAAIEAL